MTRAPLTIDVIRSNQDDADAIVEAGEVLDMRFPSGSHMSLRGGKLFHLLLDNAGIKVSDDVTHKIPLASLNQKFHITIPDLMDLIDELHTTTLKLKLTDTKGRKYTKSGPVLSDVEREEETTHQAELRYQFSPTMRRIIANSNHWAIISKSAVLAFESRYSLNLYTSLSIRAGLRKTSEFFLLDDLREILGVPSGKLSVWKNLRLRALEPAISEINQLAGFTALYRAETRGRKVVGVHLSWGQKNRTALAESFKELGRSKVGRKARRSGSVDTILEAEGREREALATALSDLGSFEEKPKTDAD